MAAEAGTLVFRHNVPVPPRTALVPLRADRIILEAIRRLDERTPAFPHAPSSDLVLFDPARNGEDVVTRPAAWRSEPPSLRAG
jgi:hypothetical protein